MTAHFINQEFELKSVLLECSHFPKSHTSANLVTALNKIIQEWNLQNKILMAISDNAANIKKAINEDLKLNHFGCYARTINLIAQDAIKNISKLIQKN